MSNETKILIKPWGQPVDWKELSGVESIKIEEEAVDLAKDMVNAIDGYYSCAPLQFSFSLRRWTNRNRKLLLQAFGYLESPRCTYKTVRRNCAKRNRIK